MILLFRIITDENPGFFRDLVIDGSDTFLDFHHTLQKDLGYDASQLASFFITTPQWEKQQEITLIDMMQESGLETRIMEETTLDEYISENGQRLIYVFDFFSERAFFMELIETADQVSPRETPFIANAKGDPPPQLALDLLSDTGKEPGTGLESDMQDMDMFDDPDNIRLDDLDGDFPDGIDPSDY